MCLCTTHQMSNLGVCCLLFLLFFISFFTATFFHSPSTFTSVLSILICFITTTILTFERRSSAITQRFVQALPKVLFFLFLLSKNRPEKGVLFPLERTTTQLDLLAVKQTPMSFFLLKYFYSQKTKSTFFFLNQISKFK